MDRVMIRVPDPDGILAGYGAGALLALERSTSETDFTGATALSSVPVISGDYLYTVWDTATTAAWYRWRARNAAGTQLGEWSDPIQGTDPAVSAHDDQAYASIDDLLLSLPEPPPDLDGRRVARMQQALVDAREQLDDEIGYSYFRSPHSGTEVRLFDGPGGGRLHVHGGIVSMTTVELRYSLNSDWETVTSDDWRLDPVNAIGDEPAFHLDLLGAVQYAAWPCGPQLIRLTGAFNWAHPPRRAIAANVAWARQALAADPSFSGGVVGPNQFGQPVAPNRLPDAVWRLKRANVERFLGCNV